MVDTFISSDDEWIVGLNSEGVLHVWGMNTGDLLYSVQISMPSSKHIGLFVTNDSTKIICVTESHIEVRYNDNWYLWYGRFIIGIKSLTLELKL